MKPHEVLRFKRVAPVNMTVNSQGKSTHYKSIDKPEGEDEMLAIVLESKIEEDLEDCVVVEIEREKPTFSAISDEVEDFAIVEE